MKTRVTVEKTNIATPAGAGLVHIPVVIFRLDGVKDAHGKTPVLSFRQDGSSWKVREKDDVIGFVKQVRATKLEDKLLKEMGKVALGDITALQAYQAYYDLQVIRLGSNQAALEYKIEGEPCKA